jgi:hypothetical protein
VTSCVRLYCSSLSSKFIKAHIHADLHTRAWQNLH